MGSAGSQRLTATLSDNSTKTRIVLGFIFAKIIGKKITYLIYFVVKFIDPNLNPYLESQVNHCFHWLG